MFVSVRATVLVDSTGNSVEVPGLLTPSGLLTPLLDYFVEYRLSRSQSWMDKVAKAVRMLLEYMHANPREGDSRAIFDNFASAVQSGTFDPQTRLDPSGLCWRPRPKDVGSIVTDLSLFFDWLGERNPKAANINPMVEANVYERRWNLAAARYRRERALLGHLWSQRMDDSNKKVRRVRSNTRSQSRAAEPPAFPEDRFGDLINEGFRVGDRVDHRGICITLLLHGAGFRASEPFHLYVEDVCPNPRNPASALVRIHHPTLGNAPPSWKDAAGRPRRGNREAYLLEAYGLRPRHRIRSSAKAGWKGGRCDAPEYKEAHWFRPEYGELFLKHWRLYLQQMVQVERHHPYLFVNLGRSPVGDMYKLGQYDDAHAAACRRIGLVVSKPLGTTPHGHRHAYGRRLTMAGVSEKYIQMFMHHSSIESQEVYVQLTTAEIEQVLVAGAARMANSASQGIAHPPTESDD